MFLKVLNDLAQLPGEVGGHNIKGLCGISKKQLESLKPPHEDNIRPRIFYLLPKIHKPSAKWPSPHLIPPGRPIVSDCSSEGYNIAAFIDHFLQPIATSHKSYIKDTNHFIKIISNLEVSKEDLIITADVDAMYTNIKHDEGIAAVKKALAQNPPTTRNPRIPDDYLLQLLEISLKCNDFQFGLDTYLQVKGTAMGKKFAPSYANIFMAQWEEDIIERATHKPQNWNRFLDDVFLIWKHGQKELDKFFTFLNNDNPCIKLKQEVSNTQVNFLDTTVFKGPHIATKKRLSTKVYHKPTDTLELLHKASHHPTHTFPGIIKSQIIRYHRLSTEQEDFKASCNQLFKALQPRGYTRRFLNRVKKQTLEHITTPYPKEIKSSKFKIYLDKPNSKHYSSKCNGKNCQTCPIIQEVSTFKNLKNDTEYHLHHSLNCKSEEVIYLITCLRCNLQYVGETSTSLQKRLWKYRNCINQQEQPPRLSLVEQHFRPENNHSGMMDLSIIPIAQCINPTGNPILGAYLRQDLEEFWIKTLNTKEPHGLNIKTQGEDKVLPLVCTYSQSTKQWSNNIIHNWYQDIKPIHWKLLPNKVLAAYRKNKNLGNILCSSRLHPPQWAIKLQQQQKEELQQLTRNNIEILTELYNED